MSNSTDESAEIGTAYRRYIEKYPKQLLQKDQRVDFDALGFWSFPLMSFSSTRRSVSIIDKDSFEQVLQKAYEQFRMDGWAGKVVLDSLEVHSIVPGFGVIEGKGTRYRTNGSALNTWDTLYAVRKAGGIWQAYMITDGLQSQPTSEQWHDWALSAFRGGGG